MIFKVVLLKLLFKQLGWPGANQDPQGKSGRIISTSKKKLFVSLDTCLEVIPI